MCARAHTHTDMYIYNIKYSKYIYIKYINYIKYMYFYNVTVHHFVSGHEFLITKLYSTQKLLAHY